MNAVTPNNRIGYDCVPIECVAADYSAHQHQQLTYATIVLPLSAHNCKVNNAYDQSAKGKRTTVTGYSAYAGDLNTFCA